MRKLIATVPIFTKEGRYVERGQFLDESEIDLVEDELPSTVVEAPSGVDGSAVVEISAIAPTGPNPQVPQQLPIGAHQVPGGYAQDGAKLVGEVTVPEKKRIELVGIDSEDDTQAKVTEALEKAKKPDLNNSDDALVEGTVADVTSKVNADASDEDLDRLLAAEKDREKPRKGVVDAIEAEQARRKEAAEA